MKLKEMIVVCLVSLFLGELFGGSVHFLVTDQEGHPVPGAFVKLKWWDLPDGSQYPVPHVKWFQATENGRIVAPVEEDEDRHVEAAGKKGYRYEDYLNPNRTECATPQEHSESNPFRIVLRKLLDEKACLLDCRYVPPRATPIRSQSMLTSFGNSAMIARTMIGMVTLTLPSSLITIGRRRIGRSR